MQLFFAVWGASVPETRREEDAVLPVHGDCIPRKLQLPLLTRPALGEAPSWEAQAALVSFLLMFLARWVSVEAHELSLAAASGCLL